MFKKSLTYTILGLIFLAYPLTAVYAGSCTVPYPVTPPNNTCNTSGSVTVNATVPESTASFSGLAPAGATITIEDNSVVVATTVADVAGVFNKTVDSDPGTHTFSLFLTDTASRTTPETVFSGINIGFHSDTPISNILLSPTVTLTRNSITNGETTSFLGQGSPGSTVHVVLNGNEVYSQVVTAGSDWQYTFNNGYNASATNSLYAFLTRGGYTNSVNSFTLSLTVGNCRRSDLNCDGLVNLTDFSILLYYWDTSNSLADINKDGTVGLIDFSIMLFDWTE